MLSYNLYLMYRGLVNSLIVYGSSFVVGLTALLVCEVFGIEAENLRTILRTGFPPLVLSIFLFYLGFMTRYYIRQSKTTGRPEIRYNVSKVYLGILVIFAIIFWLIPIHLIVQLFFTGLVIIALFAMLGYRKKHKVFDKLLDHYMVLDYLNTEDLFQYQGCKFILYVDPDATESTIALAFMKYYAVVDPDFKEDGRVFSIEYSGFSPRQIRLINGVWWESLK